jgi:cytochrome b6-f complex iron-sulfur subunit
MNRKKFLSQVGIGAAAILIPACIGGLSGCKKTDTAPTSVDFTIDIGSGPLSVNGGFLISNRIIVARTNTGAFLAVFAECTHEGTDVNYEASGNNFVCPNHGAQFNSNGVVTQGPAKKDLQKYNTSLTGTTLRVFS